MHAQPHCEHCLQLLESMQSFHTTWLSEREHEKVDKHDRRLSVTCVADAMGREVRCATRSRSSFLPLARTCPLLACSIPMPILASAFHAPQPVPPAANTCFSPLTVPPPTPRLLSAGACPTVPPACQQRLPHPAAACFYPMPAPPLLLPASNPCLPPPPQPVFSPRLRCHPPRPPACPPSPACFLPAPAPLTHA